MVQDVQEEEGEEEGEEEEEEEEEPPQGQNLLGEEVAGGPKDDFVQPQFDFSQWVGKQFNLPSWANSQQVVRAGVLLPDQDPDDEIPFPQTTRAISYTPPAGGPTLDPNNPILDPTTWTQQRNPMVAPEFVLPVGEQFGTSFKSYVWDSKQLNKDLFPGLFGQNTGALVPYGSATIPLSATVAADVVTVPLPKPAVEVPRPAATAPLPAPAVTTTVPLPKPITNPLPTAAVAVSPLPATALPLPRPAATASYVPRPIVGSLPTAVEDFTNEERVQEEEFIKKQIKSNLETVVRSEEAQPTAKKPSRAEVGLNGLRKSLVSADPTDTKRIKWLQDSITTLERKIANAQQRSEQAKKKGRRLRKTKDDDISIAIAKDRIKRTAKQLAELARRREKNIQSRRRRLDRYDEDEGEDVAPPFDTRPPEMKAVQDRLEAQRKQMDDLRLRAREEEDDRRQQELLEAAKLEDEAQKYREIELIEKQRAKEAAAFYLEQQRLERERKAEDMKISQEAVLAARRAAEIQKARRDALFERTVNTSNRLLHEASKTDNPDEAFDVIEKTADDMKKPKATKISLYAPLDNKSRSDYTFTPQEDAQMLTRAKSMARVRYHLAGLRAAGGKWPKHDEEIMVRLLYSGGENFNTRSSALGGIWQGLKDLANSNEYYNYLVTKNPISEQKRPDAAEIAAQSAAAGVPKVAPAPLKAAPALPSGQFTYTPPPALVIDEKTEAERLERESAAIITQAVADRKKIDALLSTVTGEQVLDENPIFRLQREKFNMLRNANATNSFESWPPALAAAYVEDLLDQLPNIKQIRKNQNVPNMLGPILRLDPRGLVKLKQKVALVFHPDKLQWLTRDSTPAEYEGAQSRFVRLNELIDNISARSSALRPYANGDTSIGAMSFVNVNKYASNRTDDLMTRIPVELAERAKKKSSKATKGPAPKGFVGRLAGAIYKGLGFGMRPHHGQPTLKRKHSSTLDHNYDDGVTHFSEGFQLAKHLDKRGRHF